MYTFTFRFSKSQKSFHAFFLNDSPPVVPACPCSLPSFPFFIVSFFTSSSFCLISSSHLLSSPPGSSSPFLTVSSPPLSPFFVVSSFSTTLPCFRLTSSSLCPCNLLSLALLSSLFSPLFSSFLSLLFLSFLCFLSSFVSSP